MTTSPVQILTVVLISLASALAFGEPATAEEQRVRSATMVYGMARPTEEEFRRLLEAQALDYLIAHVGLSAGGESLEIEKWRFALDTDKRAKNVLAKTCDLGFGRHRIILGWKSRSRRSSPPPPGANGSTCRWKTAASSSSMIGADRKKELVHAEAAPHVLSRRASSAHLSLRTAHVEEAVRGVHR